MLWWSCGAAAYCPDCNRNVCGFDFHSELWSIFISSLWYKNKSALTSTTFYAMSKNRTENFELTFLILNSYDWPDIFGIQDEAQKILKIPTIKIFLSFLGFPCIQSHALIQATVNATIVDSIPNLGIEIFNIFISSITRHNAALIPQPLKIRWKLENGAP